MCKWWLKYIVGCGGVTQLVGLEPGLVTERKKETISKFDRNEEKGKRQKERKKKERKKERKKIGAWFRFIWFQVQSKSCLTKKCQSSWYLIKRVSGFENCCSTVDICC